MNLELPHHKEEESANGEHAIHTPARERHAVHTPVHSFRESSSHSDFHACLLLPRIYLSIHSDYCGCTLFIHHHLISVATHRGEVSLFHLD